MTKLFRYNTLEAVPGQRNTDVVDFGNEISNIVGDSSVLILDFIGWSETYYLALNSRLPMNKLLLASIDNDVTIQKEKLRHFISENKNGVIVLTNEKGVFSNIICDLEGWATIENSAIKIKLNEIRKNALIYSFFLF